MSFSWTGNELNRVDNVAAIGSALLISIAFHALRTTMLFVRSQRETDLRSVSITSRGNSSVSTLVAR